MILRAILIGLWAALLLSKGTPMGNSLHLWMVAKPAAELSRVRRGTLFGVTALALIAFACWWLIGQEGVLMFSFGLPELTGALAMIDLGVVVDMAVLVVASVATGGWQVVRTALAWRIRPRAGRTRRSRPQRKPAANDDGDGAGFLRAA